MAMRSMIPAHDRTVVFANLPPEANELWLRTILAPIALVQSVEFLHGPGGTLQANVAFPTPEQAQAAMHFHGQIALGQAMPGQLPPDAFLKNPQQMIQPQMGRYPLALNIDLNSHHGGRPRIAGQPSLAGQRHRTVEVEPTHKNLYVLNLPLDATTDQLAALFANYGGVVHCVILAMLDAQARRRGFIDMASPNAAKEAIEALNGFVWHGYPIEVSYAIVQRSGGPFEQGSGRQVIKRNVPRNRFNTGPRRVPSDAVASPLSVGRQPGLYDGGVMAANGIVGFQAGAQVNPAMFDTPLLPGGMGVGPFNDMQTGNFNAMPAPMPSTDGSNGSGPEPRSLFISGLDPVAIMDEDDLRKALEPYGPTLAVWLHKDDAGTSRGFAMVIFVHEASARRARAELDGKVANGRKLTAYHVALTRPIMELLPRSSASSTSSPAGGSSTLASGLSLADVSSFTSSPEYRRGEHGYSLTGTPASNVPSLPSSSAASMNGPHHGQGHPYHPHPTFSTPQPMSGASSGSEFFKYNLPQAPATEGAPPQAGAGANGVRPHAGFAHHLGFSPETWSSNGSVNHANAGAGSSSTTELAGSAGLAEPFVPRSKGVHLESAFESPLVNTLGQSPSTLRTNTGGGAFSSASSSSARGGGGGAAGLLDANSFEFYPGDHAGSDSGADDGRPSVAGAASVTGASRPLSRASGSLGVTLGSDVAASIAAAVNAPPSSMAKAVGNGNGHGNGAIADSTPKLDGVPFPGSSSVSVHSTPLTRRGHGHGHAHMYSHLTRSAGGAGTSFGSLGSSVSHAGSTGALSAVTSGWARTPQSSLSSLEHVSPASGTLALGGGAGGAKGTPSSVFASKPFDEEAGAGAAFSFPSSSNGSDRAGTTPSAVALASASASASPWAGFGGRVAGGPAAAVDAGVGAPWTSPQAVAGAARDGPRQGGGAGANGSGSMMPPPAPSSVSSSVTETGSHSALRSLHQGSPPYSAALDNRYRKTPMAPVGHEKSASMSSPRARLSSGSAGAVRNGTPGGYAAAAAAAAASSDLAGALGGLNIST